MNLSTMTTNNPTPRPQKKTAAKPPKRSTTQSAQENFSTMRKTLKSGNPWPVKRNQEQGSPNRLDTLKKQLVDLQQLEQTLEAQEAEFAEHLEEAKLEAAITAKLQELLARAEILQEARGKQGEHNLTKSGGSEEPTGPDKKLVTATQTESSEKTTTNTVPVSQPDFASSMGTVQPEKTASLPQGSYLSCLLSPKETGGKFPSLLNLLPLESAAVANSPIISTPIQPSVFSTITFAPEAIGSSLLALPNPAPLVTIAPPPNVASVSTSSPVAAPSAVPSPTTSHKKKPKKSGVQKIVRQLQKTPKKLWQARAEIAKIIVVNGFVAACAAYVSRAPVANELANRTIPVQQKAIVVQLRTLAVNNDPNRKLRDDLIQNDPCGAGYAYQKIVKQYPEFVRQTATRQLEVLSLDPKIRSKVKTLTAAEGLIPTAGCSLFYP
jgi:hypothetical protein